MNKEFSKSWIKSKQPRKQRKFKANAPLHIKKKFVRAPLSEELKSKSKKRTFGIKTGDKVKIQRGQFKGQSGKVEKVNLKTSKLFITGIETIKKDGSKTLYPVHASNVMIESLSLDDKKRKQKFEMK